MEISPNQSCRKCGKKYWIKDSSPMVWSCIYCGNYLYFTYGVFKQQIDFIMASKRRKDYVRDDDKSTTAPKTSEEVKKIRFDKNSSRD